jgi:hypothetical protein
MHWCAGEVFDVLLTEFGCALECFASPLNCRRALSPVCAAACRVACRTAACCTLLLAVMRACTVSAVRPQPHRYARFCSAHLDVDGAFGSLGSFFDFHPCAGSYQASRARAAARAYMQHSAAWQHGATAQNMLQHSVACCIAAQPAAARCSMQPSTRRARRSTVSQGTGGASMVHTVRCVVCIAQRAQNDSRMHTVRSIVPVRCTPLAAGEPAV